MSKKVLLVGNNVDKGKLDNIMTKVSRDRDLRRLIRRGNIILIKTIIILCISLITIGIGIFGEHFKIQLSIVGIALLCQNVYSFLGDLKDATDKSMKWINYIRYYISAKRPRTPLDIWRFMQGSVADIQMLNTCEQVRNEKFDVVYTGLPYYETVYIDSIVMRWYHKGNIFVRAYKTVRQYWAYRKFFKEYAEKTVIAKADAKYFKNGDNHIECSNAGFGMLFFTQYLKQELLRRGVKYDSKINIKINLQDQPNYKKENGEKVVDIKKTEAIKRKKIRCIEQWIRYCTTPEFFTINEKNSKEDIVEIIDIATDDEKLGKKNKLCKFFYRIPVKKFIVYPKQQNEEAIYPLPEKYVGNNTGEKYEFFNIGGAEQNLALQCVANYYRWHENGKLKIGFAENAFENGYDDGFLMGTEGLVYGVRANPIGRLVPQEEPSCKAEVFHLQFNTNMPNIEFYGIYGYSAMATKMALCKLMNCMSKVEEDREIHTNNDIKKNIPGMYKETSELMDYTVSNTPEKKVFKTKEGIEFDQKDMMNNTEYLEEYLKKYEGIGSEIKENIYEVVNREVTKIGRFEVVMDTVEKDGKEYPYSFVKIKPGVCVIPFVTENKILVQKEYRHAIGSYQYQFPCGGIDSSENPDAAALRELVEETGYRAERIEYIGNFYPSFGSTTEEIYLYKAYFDKETSKEILESGGISDRAKKEPLEVISVEIMTVKEIDELVKNGVFKNGAGLVAWMRKEEGIWK